MVPLLNLAKLNLFFILPHPFSRKKMQQRDGDDWQEPWAHLLCPEEQMEGSSQALGPGVDTDASHRARTALF